MRIISKKKLKDFWSTHPNAEQPLRAWHDKAKLAEWNTSSDIKKAYRNASFVANNRVIFNIKGNKYRLVVAINYSFGVTIQLHPIFVRFALLTYRKYRFRGRNKRIWSTSEQLQLRVEGNL